MQKIRTITINLPIRYVEKIRQLVDKRIYPSQSEILRLALRDLLKKELGFLDILNKNDCLKEDGEWLKIISVNVPDNYVDIIAKLIYDTYPSRSEFARVAMHDFIEKEFKLEKDWTQKEAITQENKENKEIVKIPILDKDNNNTHEFKTYHIIKRLE